MTHASEALIAELEHKIKQEQERGAALFDQCRAVGLELKAAREQIQALQDRISTAGTHGPLAGDDLPPILVLTLPKSGTMYLGKSLSEGLGKVNLAIPSGGIFPRVNFAQSAVETLVRKRAVYIIHAAPNRYNFIELGAHLDRMVIHVRDPRQAIVSWCHFLPKVVANTDPVQALHFGLPADFLKRSFTDQLDWMIDHHLEQWVEWIKGWVDAADNGALPTRILFLRHEDLVADLDGYFLRLLAFFGISNERFQMPKLPVAGERNFRSGETQEWRRVMSEGQQRRSLEKIPVNILQKFGWA